MFATRPKAILTRYMSSARSSVGMARDQVAGALRRWGLEILVDDASLIISELATNAIRSSRPDGVIKVHVRWTVGEVVLGVWDGCDELPVKRSVSCGPEETHPDPEALDTGHDDGTGGWGLPLVDALAPRREVEVTPPAGKWVLVSMPVSVHADRAAR